MKQDKPTSEPKNKSATPRQKIKQKVEATAERVQAKQKKIAATVKATGDKIKAERAKKAANKNAIKENRTELLFLIVNRNKTEYYADLLHSFDVNLELIVPARGTADAGMMAMLGFTDTDKSLLIGVIKSNKISDAFATLDEKFKTIRNGKGIAYTIPMTGVIGTLIYGFLSNNRKAVKDEKESAK